MKPKKVVFVDESLEKSFNELNEADSVKKAYKYFARRCFFREKRKEKSNSKNIYSEIWNKQFMDLQPPRWLENVIHFNSL